MKKTVFSGDLLWPDGAIRPGTVTTRGGKIDEVHVTTKTTPEGELLKAPPGGVIAPGLIELQLNGAFGHDFTYDPESIPTVAKQLPRFGVTSFLPTLITAPIEQYHAAMRVLEGLADKPQSGAHILGLHLEGPFLSPARPGAHPVDYLRLPGDQRLAAELGQQATGGAVSVAAMANWINARWVRLVTLAPELPGALELINVLILSGITVGLGHSDATYAETEQAVEAGAHWTTHLFNAMRSLNHREPGIVGAALTDDRVRVALIPDGIHVHPALMEMVAKLKGQSGVTLISDGMAASGMSPGTYQLAGQEVTVDENSARLPDGRLAGSVILLDQAVRGMVMLAGRPLSEALFMATRSPALVLGLENKGSLISGCDADLVCFGPDLHVEWTVIGGEVVYQR